MKKLCWFLTIVYVADNAHQFPSNDKEMRCVSPSEELTYEAAFNPCQSILTQMISKLDQKGDTYKLLQQTGTRVKFWIFENRISDPNLWCKSGFGMTPIHFNWNSAQNNCVNLKVFNDNGSSNFTKYICDLDTNSSNSQGGFTDLTFESGTITKSNFRTKRSLTRKFIRSYVNLPKEIESTECSMPTLNVYLKTQLIFSNASGVVGDDIPMDTIEIYINDDFSHFINEDPGWTQKEYHISADKLTFSQAKAFCTGIGMNLVTAPSEGWTDIVVSVLPDRKTDRFWMLGNKLSGDWSWSELGIMDYHNWDGGEPNNEEGEENCIEFITERGGTWNDIRCDKLRYYICEKVLWTKPGYRVSPIVNIFVGDSLAYQNLPTDHQDESNNVEVKIAVDGVDDHSTKFLLLKKNSPQGETLEQRLVTPKNFIDSEFNGIDIRIQDIKQKGLICEREKFYDVHTDKKLNYEDAQKFCQNRSMQLVSIQNEMQHLHIEKIMLNLNINHYYWTSGYQAEDEAIWLWNGNEAITYFNWAKGEPDNLGGNEKCIEIFVPWKTTKWNDQDCQDKNRIICESYTEPYWRLIED